MANTNTGILLDEDFDLKIENGSFVHGDSTLNEAAVVLSLNKAELKSDPLLGPDLVRVTRSPNGQKKVSTLAKLHLERDGKNYEDIKRKMTIGNG